MEPIFEQAIKNIALNNDWENVSLYREKPQKFSPGVVLCTNRLAAYFSYKIRLHWANFLILVWGSISPFFEAMFFIACSNIGSIV